MAGLIYQGTLKMDHPDLGMLEDLGNVTGFKTWVETTQLLRSSREPSKLNHVVDVIHEITVTKVEFTVDDITPVLFSVAFQSSGVGIPAPVGQTGDWVQVASGSSAQTPVALEFCGNNLVNGLSGICKIPKAMLVAEGRGWDAMNEEFNTMKFKGICVLEASETAPLYWRIQTAI